MSAIFHLIKDHQSEENKENALGKAILQKNKNSSPKKMQDVIPA